MEMRIGKVITFSEFSRLMRRSQQARQSDPVEKRQVSLTSRETELSIVWCMKEGFPLRRFFKRFGRGTIR
jgi:hypothetical protein